MPAGATEEAPFKRVRLLALLFLVAAPLIYLVIIYALRFPRRSGGEYEMMLYILLIVAMIQPAAYPFIQRFHLTMPGRGRQPAMQPDQLFFTLTIIKFAFVEAIYIYGLVVAFISGVADNALYFYAIGIIWTFIYWPRRGAYEHFMQKAHKL